MNFSELDLAKRIDEHVVQQDDLRTAERVEMYGAERDRFYVSEAGKCPRQVAYSFYGLPREKLDGRVLRLLSNGDKLQERYSEYFKAMGVWLGEEVPVSTAEVDEVPFLMSGRLDILINYKKLFGLPYDEENLTNDDKAIIEMKSINTWGFKRVQASGEPQLDHLYQIMIYMWLTGIHRGWIIYEDKNDQSLLTIPIEFDERIIYGSGDGRSKGILAEFNELSEILERGEVPPRCAEANKHSFPCSWKSGNCDFYHHCWDPEHDGRVIPSNIIEFGGKVFDLDNLPEGFSKEDVLRAKELWELINPPSTDTEQETETETEQEQVAEPAQETESTPASVIEFVNADGERAFYCPHCGMETSFKRLGKSGTVACKHCGERSVVAKED